MKGRLTLRDRKFVILGQDGEEQVLPCRLLERTVRVPHESDSLRLLVFSDYRVQNIDSLRRFLKSQEQLDLILYAGDDIRRFHEGGTNFFEELAEMSRYGLCAVAGNDDKPEVRELIAGRNVFPVHSCALALAQFVIIGIEGAPMFPTRDGFDSSYNRGYLLYPEPILDMHIKRAMTAFNQKKLIIIILPLTVFWILPCVLAEGILGAVHCGISWNQHRTWSFVFQAMYTVKERVPNSLGTRSWSMLRHMTDGAIPEGLQSFRSLMGWYRRHSGTKQTRQRWLPFLFAFNCYSLLERLFQTGIDVDCLKA